MIARRRNTVDKGRISLPSNAGFGKEMAGQKDAANVNPALTTNEGSFVMAPTPDTGNAPGVQPDSFRVYALDERKASEAYAVHTALLRAELHNPALRDNSEWTMHRQDAYERFALAFKALS